jgi:hypothetical protein
MRLQVWRVHMEEYYDHVESWRIKRAALRLAGAGRVWAFGEMLEENPLPDMPPCPSHMPEDDVVEHMVRSCREKPHMLPGKSRHGEHDLILKGKEEQKKEVEKLDDEKSLELNLPEVDVMAAGPLSARDYLPKVPDPSDLEGGPPAG